MGELHIRKGILAAEADGDPMVYRGALGIPRSISTPLHWLAAQLAPPLVALGDLAERVPVAGSSTPFQRLVPPIRFSLAHPDARLADVTISFAAAVPTHASRQARAIAPSLNALRASFLILVVRREHGATRNAFDRTKRSNLAALLLPAGGRPADATP